MTLPPLTRTPAHDAAVPLDRENADSRDNPDGEEAPATLLRLATAGSVDDGKSTLVGRLLHDSHAVLADQLAAVARASRQRGLAAADLALLTDGLRAEREQGITIDVAYRYFATARRRFILADTPGHVQYTRNMVTGASTGDLAVVLVDARGRVREQTRRHLAVAALLRVPRLVLAVNKMDLVGHAEPVFAAVALECAGYAAELGVHDLVAIPVSALNGDNVVHPSASMDWYSGPTLLEHLESVEPLAADEDPQRLPMRFPVQCVVRAPESGPLRGYRGYAGRVASGVVRLGDPVAVLPSGRTSTVVGIDRMDQDDAELAVADQSVTLRLADDLDVGRGDLIVPVDCAPPVGREFTATVCHLDARPLRAGDQLLLRQQTALVRAVVRSLDARLDLTTLTALPAPNELEANDIGQITVATAEALPLDEYRDNRRTGAFLLIDPADGSTLTAGMVGGLQRGGRP
ncbi:sulfate adenylyltransferase subunit 1 [Streptacidiphilus fuscans]|uniref:sulfate adenylyltransferase n=1 Tax=Streptacidiphilus fuscans TaxID=2789292 RepID=A0A931FHJ1_9ACTN|nr:GTP-binding protein [Streptacidiphilus fuscans]MBF9073668.1 50S ribosome-binding GTPase [Streptacidiphilus fuscans]